jgi:hypothetical protein
MANREGLERRVGTLEEETNREKHPTRDTVGQMQRTGEAVR